MCFASSSSYIYADSHASCLFSSLLALKVCLWLLYRVLKGPSVRPKYVISGLPAAETVALYTILDLRHSPSRGHVSGFLQLHVLGTSSGPAKIFALWEAIMAPMLGMQL